MNSEIKKNTEYQIFIGLGDYHLQDELISEDELREMVAQFFRRKEIDFSMFSVKGGYLREDGIFVSENTLCIDIMGSNDLDIIRLAKSISVFMNQEHALVVKDVIASALC